MKTSLFPLLLAGLLLVGCTDKKESAESTESVDLLPTDSEVQDIDQAAQEAAEAITEENADDVLGDLEAAIEADQGGQ